MKNQYFKAFLETFKNQETSSLIESFKSGFSILFESGLYISSKEVAPEIRSWVNEVLGKNLQKYSLYQAEEIQVGMPWHEAARDYYQLFKLLPDNHADRIEQVSFERSGMEGAGSITGKEIEGKGKVPAGTVMVKVTTYPERAEIFTSEDVQKFLPPTETPELSDIELLALHWAKSLKSAYRPKASEDIYNSLIGKGLMAKNRSITISGRNLINNPEIVERLEKVKQGRKKEFPRISSSGDPIVGDY